MKFKNENVKIVKVQEWDSLVKDTYGRPYSFQQQDGCQPRGTFRLSVPSEAEDYENSSVPEIVNHEERGVSFEAWLSRDPKAPLSDDEDECREDKWAIDLWWDRNFYPDLQMVANDLHKKGLLEAGEYLIIIDW